MALLEYKNQLIFGLSDFDSSGTVKPGSVLRAFQKSADEHAEKENFGTSELEKYGLIWIIAKQRYEVLTGPEPNAEYTITTYPHQRKGVLYLRDYYISDNTGAVFIKGAAQWCMVNNGTRALVRTKLDYQGEFYEPLAFSDGFRRIAESEGECISRHIVSESDIDKNMHTNNCRYADMITGAGICGISSFDIRYNSETHLGDTVFIFADNGEPEKLITAKLQDGKNVFSSKISLLEIERSRLWT